MRRRVLIAGLCLSLVVAGCSEAPKEAEQPKGTTTTTQNDDFKPVGAPPELKLTEIAKLDRPTAIATRDGDDSLFVAEKSGFIRTVTDNEVNAIPVLDISNEVSDQGEQGLLGLAFRPQSSVFYVNFTDNSGNTQIVEYRLDNGGRADLRSRRQILSVQQPYANHNGGQLAFGPEGALYIALGDGGGANDPNKNAQDLSSLLGKILRIRPEAPSNGLPYTIPFDNPFADRAGARGEIWAYGLRNPWRFSFDPKDRSMWIADVGQDSLEEINHRPYDPAGGVNYGWPLLEGTKQLQKPTPSEAVMPVYEYPLANGKCAVTGGYVYRGKNIPDLTGRYLFGDFCTGEMWTLTERGTNWEADPLNTRFPNLGSFGQDANGELYVLSQSGALSRIDKAD